MTHTELGAGDMCLPHEAQSLVREGAGTIHVNSSKPTPARCGLDQEGKE